jgi:lambda family phage portal protein
MNPLDAAIAFFSPSWGIERAQARATMAQINAVSNTKAGYKAGQINRFNAARLTASVKEHALPAAQFDRLVADSFDLYRNNTYVRKIVSSLQSKVVGSGMQPEPLAANEDGSPNVAFRRRAKQLWASIQSGFDFRGKPGKGGLTLGSMQSLALRMAVLSGNVLYRLVPIDASEQLSRELPVPLSLQLIDASRLATTQDVPQSGLQNGNQFYRGIELDYAGRRVAYWINAVRAGESSPSFSTAKRRPASEIGHLFLEDDLDQYIGTPWMASAITGLRDTGDLQFNVLKSSAMAACVVASYSLPTGARRVGLNAASETQPGSADGTDLTDSDGNAITKLQPAMMINTGQNGSFNLHSPNQPNLNPEAFIQHLLRGTAAGIPGIKSSTVTGDYRNSSFSSEKSADNDTWPEIESLQSWFASGFCQPIWEAVVRAAVLSGYFDGIVSADEFAGNQSRYTSCKWQGPISRSINPVDDADAAGRRMQLGLSSPQMECAKQGVNWRDVMSDVAEVYTTAESVGLPDEVVNNILGVGANDVIAQTNKATADTTQANEVANA